jgi:glycosyltransferase involved in cell wall biosynthesis
MSSKILPVSIVIPTKNESKLLPRLLKSINEQEYKPLEVIVSDAFSEDETRAIALKHGAEVVDGGILSIGRNNGAKASEGEIIFFMDADALLPDKKFLKRVYDRFIKSGADIGSTLLKIDNESKKYPAAVFFYTWYGFLKRVSGMSKKPFIESGLFLISTRDAFMKIGGFKEIKHGIPEDLEYMLHGINLGLKYKVLNVKIIGSARRYHNIFSSIKTIIGAILCGWVVQFNLYDKKRFVDFSSKMYGELGGKKDKKKRRIVRFDEEKWNSRLEQAGKKIKTLKIATTVAAVAGTLAGAGLIISKIARKNKKDSENEKTLDRSKTKK